MVDRNNPHGYQALIIVIAGSILLASIGLLVALAQRSPAETIVLQPPTPTPTLAPTHTPTPEPTSTWTPQPTSTSTLEAAEPSDHLWLGRPIPPTGEQKVDRFYPYGSTGVGKYRIHHGVEFQNPEDAPVLAAARGKVVVAGRDEEIIYGAKPNFYGQLVVVELERAYKGGKVYNLYGHLSQIDVEVGEVVEEGAILGKVGMTGSAFGPHLHFEVRVGENSYDRSRNPELWLRPLPGRGTIAGHLSNAQGKPSPESLITLYNQGSPEHPIHEIYTYPEEEVNPDDIWKENFAMGDVPEGTYLLKAMVGGRLYQTEVEVVAGEIAFVDIRAE